MLKLMIITEQFTRYPIIRV